jgi:hypothetical protein
LVQELLADGKKILFETEDLSKVSFANTDIARVRFSQITKWGQRDKFKIVEERELEEHLEYAKSIKHLLNRKDVMKEVEQRQTHFYDNKNYLDIEVNWNENSIKARAHNSSAEYEKNGKILKVQPNDLKIRFNQIKGIYGMLQESYKYRLRADEAGKFFVREMEAKRKELLNGNIHDRLKSISLFAAKWLSYYGQSAFLPLFIWTPVFIILFTFIRFILGTCSASYDHGCSTESKVIDALLHDSLCCK